MDVPLYGIALTLFAVLYLAIGIFLAYTIIITLIVMFLYLVLRNGRLPEDYQYSGRDATITLIFIGITWAIFTFLAPKSPIPFLGSGLTYSTTGYLPMQSVLLISVVVTVLFLAIFSVVQLGDSSGSGGQGQGDSGDKAKQGVGA